MSGRRRAPSNRPPLLRYVVPVAAGVVVFGAATAFAASMTVTSTGLGSGNGSVASCNASVSVSYNTEYNSAVPGYRVTTTPITTNVTACANKAYKVTLTNSSNASLSERTGTLNASGNADGASSPNFASALPNVPAASVTGISVVITG